MKLEETGLVGENAVDVNGYPWLYFFAIKRS